MKKRQTEGTKGRSAWMSGWKTQVVCVNSRDKLTEASGTTGSSLSIRPLMCVQVARWQVNWAIVIAVLDAVLFMGFRCGSCFVFSVSYF